MEQQLPVARGIVRGRDAEHDTHIRPVAAQSTSEVVIDKRLN